MSRLTHDCCPFFQVAIVTEEFSERVSKWRVHLYIYLSRQGRFNFKGYSIDDQVILEEEFSALGNRDRKFVHDLVETLWDSGWWHTQYCRACPITKDKDLCLSSDSESENSDSESETSSVRDFLEPEREYEYQFGSCDSLPIHTKECPRHICSKFGPCLPFQKANPGPTLNQAPFEA